MRYIAGFIPLAVLLGKFDCSNRLNKSDSVSTVETLPSLCSR